MAGGERGWTGDLIITSAAVLSSSCGAEECDVAGRAGGAESAGEGGCVDATGQVGVGSTVSAGSQGEGG